MKLTPQFLCGLVSLAIFGMLCGCADSSPETPGARSGGSGVIPISGAGGTAGQANAAGSGGAGIPTAGGAGGVSSTTGGSVGTAGNAGASTPPIVGAGRNGAAGNTPSGNGGTAGGAGPSGVAGAQGMAAGGNPGSGGGVAGAGMRPFPANLRGTYCIYPTNAKSADVILAYEEFKTTVVTSDGAGGFQRVKKPDSGTVIGSTVSEGIGYGMLLAVYMGDQPLFDNLWKYSQLHLDAQGFMNWEIGPDGKVTSGGNGGATDGDEDIAWALVMADKQWGGRGTLSDTYLNLAKRLIDLIWQFEVDHTRGEMLKPGNQWGNVDVTNPSYFAPAYYRVFGQVTGKTADWNKVVDSSYAIIEKSLNATSGNAANGLVPAWCNSAGTPVAAYAGAPLFFQNDSTRTPFRVGQDYCYFGEPRAKAYLAKISGFYSGVGVGNITNGYALNGTPQPEKVFPAGLQAASFVGPAGVGAMSDAKYQQFVNDAYAAVATLKLTAGTIYYQKSWAALSLLMMTGNFVNFTAP